MILKTKTKCKDCNDSKKSQQTVKNQNIKTKKDLVNQQIEDQMNTNITENILI